MLQQDDPGPGGETALVASVDRSESQLNRGIGDGAPRRLWAVLQRNVHGVLSCLALAFGFAAFTPARGMPSRSLLMQLQEWSLLGRFSRPGR